MLRRRKKQSLKGILETMVFHNRITKLKRRKNGLNFQNLELKQRRDLNLRENHMEQEFILPIIAPYILIIAPYILIIAIEDSIETAGTFGVCE
jgi:hypothetical protein|tara:strand:+ start:898 stop:1176 length:279 start_codon:yes stop_codon:yes gene_type:complete